MKRLNYLFYSLILFMASTINLFATGDPPGGGGRDGVGVPLDGGLLAILAAAGVSYYVARKRKKADK